MRCIGLDRSECYGFAGASGLCSDCKHERALKLLREFACYAPPTGKAVTKAGTNAAVAKVPADLLHKAANHIAMVQADRVAQDELTESAKRHKKQEDADLAAGRAIRLAEIGDRVGNARVLPSVGGAMLGEPSRGRDK